MSGLIGRAHELAELGALVETRTLITVTGPPGVGKTRLVRELARRHDEQTVFVDLAAVRDGALVVAAAAFALSVQEVPGKTLQESVIARLRQRRSLLLLDNCEHVIDASRDLAAALIRGCADLSIVATSREPLALAEEQVWPLLPLAVPHGGELEPPESLLQYPAIRLFVERAAAAQHGFRLTSYVAPAVAEVCQRLDGIPLAIELAAARVDTLTPAELAARLADRLYLLTNESGGATPRHETLGAALDWSYELLSPPERALLRRLSVFAGGFDAAAVAKVCPGGEVPARSCNTLLAALVSKSLVSLEADRYRLLETVLAYAGDRLERAGEVVALREAHAGYYVLLAETLEPELTASNQAITLERLDRERDNLHRALDWCLGHAHDDWALRLAGALVLFWRLRSRFSEGRELLEAALAAGESGAPLARAKAQWGAGFLSMMTADYELAATQLESSLATFREYGDVQGEARALLILANCNQSLDPATVMPLLEQSTALSRQVGDGWCLSHALGVAAFHDLAVGELPAARHRFEECLAAARAPNDNQGLRFGLIGFGWVALLQGEYGEAESSLEEALAISSELEENFDTSQALRLLGRLALDRGEHVRADELLNESLALMPAAAPLEASLDILLALAKLAHAQGQRDRAVRLLDEAHARGGSELVPTLEVRGNLAAETGDLEEARRLFHRMLDRTRTSQDKDATANAKHGLGRLARMSGDLGESAMHHKEALELRRQVSAAPGMVASIESLAGLAAAGGRAHHAARLLGAASRRRRERGYARPPWEAATYDADIAGLRAGLGAADFAHALAEGDKLSLEEAAELALNRGPRRGRPPHESDALTEREQQVAHLAAEGLTNREIADRLVITAATVKYHLAHVFSKLHVTRRAELAREVWRVAGDAGLAAPSGNADVSEPTTSWRGRTSRGR